MIPPQLLKELQPWHTKYQLNALQICALMGRNEPIPHDMKLFHYYIVAQCNLILHKYHTKQCNKA